MMKHIDKRSKRKTRSVKERPEPRTQPRPEESNENIMKETRSLTVQKSTKTANAENRQGDLRILSAVFSSAESPLESLIDNSAQRLHNVMHSLIESREKAYLTEDENGYPPLSLETAETVVKLSQEVRQYMNLRLDLVKTKVKVLRELREGR